MPGNALWCAGWEPANLTPEELEIVRKHFTQESKDAIAGNNLHGERMGCWTPTG